MGPTDASERSLEGPRSPTINQSASAGREASGFDAFDLRPELLRAVRAAGFETPRPIQAQALPPALRGRDVLGLAQTGTGKTAAFALPILTHLQAGHAPKGRQARPRALIVTPTRELSAQVLAECELLGKYTPLGAQAVFGGIPVPRQVRALASRPDILVACPGRLLDLVGQRALSLDAVEILVLDEADHMFDMGFLPDVRRILRALPRERQNLFFSATMPKEIRKLAEEILHRPIRVEIEHGKRAATIEHGLIRLEESDKQGQLRRLLAADDFRSAIVFTRTKARARRLAQKLEKSGHAATALQGNMSQNARNRAMDGFRSGSFDVLVATDIAARGIDVAGVSHVINFDVPNTPEAYTHRIGRTGRAERQGSAFTFATRDDGAQIRAIEKHLGEKIPVIDAATGSMPARSASPRPTADSRGDRKPHEDRPAPAADRENAADARRKRRSQRRKSGPKSQAQRGGTDDRQSRDSGRRSAAKPATGKAQSGTGASAPTQRRTEERPFGAFID
ncbi:MAG: DEAD/DEAH box helicase [Planctomycetota bacterium]|jgi:ATP-dependent RNA helicase RhlE